MRIILPIDRQYHQRSDNKDAILQLLVDYFPGGLTTLAYLCVVLKDELRDFVNDACIMLLESYNQVDDESLADYVFKQINDLCGNEEFLTWLSAFHTTHAGLYSEYLRGIDLDECSQEYENTDNKLYIRI